MIGVNQIMIGERADVKVTLPQHLHRDPEKAKQQQSHLRECLRGLLYTIDTYATESPLRDFVIKSLGLGLGVLSYPIDWERWPDPPFGKLKNGKPRQPVGAAQREEYARWERKRQTSLPWAVSSTHPRNVFFDPYHDPPEDYIIEEKISRSAANRQYPDRNVSKPDAGGTAARQPARGTSTCLRVTYCSADWYAVYVDGKAVLGADDNADEEGVAPNTAGVAWHRMAFGGFGDKDEDGDFEVRMKGIIRDGRDIILMKITNLNVMEAIRQITAFSPLEVHGGEEAERMKVMESFVYGPATFTSTPPSITIRPIPQTVVPDVVFKQEEEVNRLMEMHFGPQILRGVEQPQETAAGQRTRVGLASAPYRSCKQNCQQAVAAMLQDLCYMIKHELQEPVTVLGTPGGSDSSLMLRPEDIVDGMLIEVDFTPPTEEDRAFKRTQLQQDLQAGAISIEDYIRESRGIEDAQGALFEIDVEQMVHRLLANPQIDQLAVTHFLQTRGQLQSPAAPGGAMSVPPPPGAVPTPAGPPAAAAMPPPQQPAPTLGSPADAQQQVNPYFAPPQPPPNLNGAAGAGRGY